MNLINFISTNNRSKTNAEKSSYTTTPFGAREKILTALEETAKHIAEKEAAENEKTYDYDFFGVENMAAASGLGCGLGFVLNSSLCGR